MYRRNDGLVSCSASTEKQTKIHCLACFAWFWVQPGHWWGSCLSSLPQAQFNSDGFPEPPLLEAEVLHVLAPPFFSGPSAEGSAVRSHGKKRWSLHRRKRNQTVPAAGAPSRGTHFCSHYGSCDLLESGFPVLHHLHHDSSGMKCCLMLSQKQERIKEVEVKMSSFLRSLT